MIEKTKNNIQDTITTLEGVVANLTAVIAYLKEEKGEVTESSEYDELPEDIRAMIR